MGCTGRGGEGDGRGDKIRGVKQQIITVLIQCLSLDMIQSENTQENETGICLLEKKTAEKHHYWPCTIPLFITALPKYLYQRSFSEKIHSFKMQIPRN